MASRRRVSTVVTVVLLVPGALFVLFPLFWLLLWGVVLFALFRSRRRWGGWHQARSPQDLLAERYAQGEISEQEYRERLTVLKSTV